MKLHLARHGQTEWNALEIVQGHSDIPLNATGRQQAAALAQRLVARPIGLILASDLRRARETSEIVQSVLQLPIATDARFREADYGSLEGLTHAQFDACCGAHNLRTHPNVLDYDFTPYGGETAVAVLKRQREAIEALVPKHGLFDVLIVGHGRSLRTLYFSVTGINRTFGNAEALEIDYDPA